MTKEAPNEQRSATYHSIGFDTAQTNTGCGKGTQSKMVAAPGASVVIPGGQGVHSVSPIEALYEPISHTSLPQERER